MLVQVQKLSPVLVEFDVTVEADKVRAEVEDAYATLARTAKLRGFRPGKVPRKVLTQMFGARVHGEVAQKLMDATFAEAVAKESVQAVTAPALEAGKLSEGAAFTYKARVEVLPEIASVNFDALPAKRPSTKPTDEAVAAELESLRKANSTLEPPPGGRPSQKGDVITLDYTVTVGGKLAEGSQSTGHQAEIGAGSLLPAVDAALEGRQAGDKMDVEVELSASHPTPELRGKQAVFHLVVQDVKERVLPALDDEFAKDLGEFESLEALRADVVARLTKELEEQAENNVAEQLVMELVKANPIPVPPSLVQRQAQLTEQEILGQARRNGNAARGLGEDLRNRVIADSEVKVRAGLLMAEIAKRENIKIGEAEIEEGLQELAAQSGKNVAKLRAEYRDQRKRELLIGMILENKVLDLIQAKAKFEEA